MKQLLIAAGIFVAATSAAPAQNGPPTGGYEYEPGVGIYDYSLGYAEPFAYEFYGSGTYGGWAYDHPRGGPGPRVGNGTGMGVGAER